MKVKLDIENRRVESKQEDLKMKFFFALALRDGMVFDRDYIRQHRIDLYLRNLVAIVVYGLIFTRIQHDNPNLAMLFVVVASCHALMVGILLGKEGE